ncbi:2,4-dienoyl-CoA reductase [Pseudoxanthobacter soli DSM 19599]|uniref:2,4-dienoyl-CoA reductase n=1 Tax=Pseudoxanthobacter soli DSM 19599 TaxID=1123029 RepID=A0A1M7ZQ41_9HYPH|nr:NADH:flavin oxidoreductase/NADH oxidase [Pseudoxanthobacter soli]SHO66766.1 2,4-dienoyl-CoA reductase [Pseudoxanthobacter soli DSM 19599]
MTAPHLFTPFQTRSVRFKNRIVLSPMCQYSALDGHVTDWHLAHHARFALGGVGGAIIEATGVLPEGRITPGCLGLWSDEQVPGLARIAALYHSEAIPVGIQLSHAGRKASAARPFDGAAPLGPDSPEPAWQTVAPSALAHDAAWPTPHALDEAEIAGIVQAFADATRRAMAAGLDFVEIHGAHGYLINTFFSPISNKRTDGYGGSLENRMRFALEVTEAVRVALPADKPLFYRVSAVDGVEGGVTIEETVALSRALAARGVDVVDASSGGILGPVARAATRPTPGFQVPYADAIRHGAGVATMAVGLIVEPHQAEAVLADGHADLVAIGRELLADGDFAYRAALELGLENPSSVLPQKYAFYLSRRKAVLAPAKAG